MSINTRHNEVFLLLQTFKWFTRSLNGWKHSHVFSLFLQSLTPHSSVSFATSAMLVASFSTQFPVFQLFWLMLRLHCRQHEQTFCSLFAAFKPWHRAGSLHVMISKSFRRSTRDVFRHISSSLSSAAHRVVFFKWVSSGWEEKVMEKVFSSLSMDCVQHDDYRQFTREREWTIKKKTRKNIEKRSKVSHE